MDPIHFNTFYAQFIGAFYVIIINNNNNEIVFKIFHLNVKIAPPL